MDLYAKYGLNPLDVRLEEGQVETFKGTQLHVQATHLPTGVSVSVRQCQTQCQNREFALKDLQQNLKALEIEEQTPESTLIVERDRTLAGISPQVDCPSCGESAEVDVQSQVSLKSALVFRFFEEGKGHFHDPNLRRSFYACSCGEKWSRYWRSKCWCGWGRGGPEADPEEPSDPTYIRLKGPLIRRRSEESLVFDQRLDLDGADKPPGNPDCL